MTFFDSEFVPGFERGPGNTEEKRRLEEQSKSEVEAFENEKQAVNEHAAVYEAIHGRADLNGFPIEIANRKA